MLMARAALAGPETSAWPVQGPDDTVGVAAAPLAGWTAASDSYEDNVEVRWLDGSLRATITKQQILALLPWMDLNGSEDGPGALAFSDSGRLLFVAVHDGAPAQDGLPDDAVLRYETQTGRLSLFARVSIATTDGPWAGESLAFASGRLIVASREWMSVWRARANDLTGTPLWITPFAAPVPWTSLAVDRATGTVFMTAGNQLWKAPVADMLNFTAAGTLPAGAVGIAFSDYYGGAGQGGLYVLAEGATAGTHRVYFVPAAQARGQQPLSPSLYYSGPSTAHGIASRCDGTLAIATDEDALVLRDTSDSRLGFTAWMRDEFAQHVAFARGLVTTGPGAGGGPAGWVIDGDVLPGGTRFHPATPDAACWAVLVLLMNDHVNGDATARATVRTILTRYAGLAADGIGPQRSADGIFDHWIEVANGGPKAGWGDRFATMSTMKIVLAASRARAAYPDDAQIAAAAEAIICGVHNWDAYFDAGARMYLNGLAGGGGDGASLSGGWHEGVIFADEAGALGGANGDVAHDAWLFRDRWPVGAYLAGRNVTGNVWGSFLPAFTGLYAGLLVPEYRASGAWRENLDNLRESNAAWTDDNAPRLFTVFSAGTTKPAWGGYHADSLSDHPGDVTTLTSLLAMVGARGGQPARVPEAYAAYYAYRTGARQSFTSGARLLYRRSSVDPAYTPPDAGLPDVALGGLGLAELLSPGSVEAVLNTAYPTCPFPPPCPADFNHDGFLDFFDADAYVAAFEGGDVSADFNADGFIDFFDYEAFVRAFEQGC